MLFIEKFNLCIFIIFAILYSYQFIYAMVGLICKELPSKNVEVKNNRIGVVIAARNESVVLGNLLDTVNTQTYPAEFIDAFVIADNCTDNTADIAREHGALVYERNNSSLIGKGYALDFFFKGLMEDGIFDNYDAFIVLDADNLLDESFVSEMNKKFCQGYKVLTSYRNSKNYDANWISASYGLWFLREARYLNNPRSILGSSCAISGTGFLVSSDIIKKNNGWHHHLLTEDIEFTVDTVTNGEKIGYCGTAVLYDEQPVKMRQSWNQRLRWSKGFYQVITHYGWRLVKGIFSGKGKTIPCFDMLMTVAPAYLITIITVLVNLVFLILGMTSEVPELKVISVTVGSLTSTLVNFYLVFLAMGLLTLITEWKNIKCKPCKKILYSLMFPIFLFTYIPISVIALFKKVRWTPVEHNDFKSIDEVR